MPINLDKEKKKVANDLKTICNVHQKRLLILLLEALYIATFEATKNGHPIQQN